MAGRVDRNLVRFVACSEARKPPATTGNDLEKSIDNHQGIKI
jgi:hypothetical protein